MSTLSYLTPAPSSSDAALQRFNHRLRDMIRTIKNAPCEQARLSVNIEEDFEGYTVEQLASKVSDRILGNVKILLGGEKRPTVAQLMTLTRVKESDTEIGDYLALAIPNDPNPESEFRFVGAYVGSTYKFGTGLKGRGIPDHGNPKHRKDPKWVI
jgi:hypothetical protein